MTAFTVTEEAISVMENIVLKFEELKAIFKQEIERLMIILEENQDGLGNHEKRICSLISEINELQEIANRNVEKLSFKLLKAIRIRNVHLESNLCTSYNSQLPQNQRYVYETINSMAKGMEQTLNKEFVLAGAQKRKLRTPKENGNNGVVKGYWEGNVYFLEDQFMPSLKNTDNKTVAEIKYDLKKKYAIDFKGIPYYKGIADFSSISIANVKVIEIITALGISEDDYKSLETNEKSALLEKVFKDRNREINFKIADKIAAEKQIPIPALESGYTGEDLGKWRKDNHFTWDEQLHEGYQLVPTIVHANIPHTGLVGTAKQTKRYLDHWEKELKEEPNKYNFDEKEASISYLDLKNKIFDKGK